MNLCHLPLPSEGAHERRGGNTGKWTGQGTCILSNSNRRKSTELWDRQPVTPSFSPPREGAVPRTTSSESGRETEAHVMWGLVSKEQLPAHISADTSLENYPMLSLTAMVTVKLPRSKRCPSLRSETSHRDLTARAQKNGLLW